MKFSKKNKFLTPKWILSINMLVVERHDFFLNGEKGGVVHGLRIMNLLEMNYLCLQRQGIYFAKSC